MTLVLALMLTLFVNGAIQTNALFPSVNTGVNVIVSADAPCEYTLTSLTCYYANAHEPTTYCTPVTSSRPPVCCSAIFLW